ncbi:MAG TPA: DUF1116 domain-containing protein [Burkholderiales bacterium]|nr:DUF1116 domain-containing protein [Burkholderiales bacterium]
MSDGLQALVAARPVWTRVARAGEVLALQGRTLLHAGPPFVDPRKPCAPVLSSAVLACIYEGWAKSEDEAERLIASGDVRLEPAQSRRCVTPLAAIVSPSTTMIVVEDAAGQAPPAYAPLGTTGGPDLRFGTRERGILDRLALRDSAQAATLGRALAEPIELLPIARAALEQGDDLHNRTTAATAALVARIEARLPRSDSLIEAVKATPLWFLTFWMAAAKLMLSAAEGKAPGTLITRMGGNGVAFGVALAGAPDRWITVSAEAPRGPCLPNADKNAKAVGAIGDSAVIDALGFGGQALEYAPEPRDALRPYLTGDPAEVARTLLQAPHPAFASKSVGVDVETIRRMKTVPIVTLGMVEASGTRGLLGRGVFRPPLPLFE